MKEFVFVGDVHGDWDLFEEIINKVKSTEETKNSKILQVGDFGINPNREEDYNFDYGEDVYFIRGNHDHPQLSIKHKNYLGDYGVAFEGQIGFISGAYTIGGLRKETLKDYWFDEELTKSQLMQAIKLIEKERPRIIISHDGPDVFTNELCMGLHPSQTGKYLTKLFRRYKPEYWICGHYHTSLKLKIEGTNFICLKELETFSL